MEGIICKRHPNVTIFYIEELTKEIKENLKKYLKIICLGIEKNTKIHSFENILKELLVRYPKESNKRKGFIAEILLNFLIRNFFNDYSIISPFFNTEERSFKKGFDLIVKEVDEKNLHRVWLIESKAGSVSENNNINSKIRAKIHEAKNDLNRRLNEDNLQIWLNAVNSVDLCMSDSDEKDTVENILSDYTTNKNSRNCYVILAGTVFHNINEKFIEEHIVNLHNKILENAMFNEVKIIAIQKGTYEKVVEYFESLVD